ncbi:Uncharacterised protein [Dermatophilus congolensis]|uniref:Uncharacterized protein n=1 Tax=Dermatophilus congolensis TaxID=1863 RepID=A0AA46BL46_9MICO|nr:Uncharacterised protein [Dermatophilus congolensis]
MRWWCVRLETAEEIGVVVGADRSLWAGALWASGEPPGGASNDGEEADSECPEGFGQGADVLFVGVEAVDEGVDAVGEDEQSADYPDHNVFRSFRRWVWG